MVDFVTQSRHYGYKYNAPERRQPISTNRDLYRQHSQLFKTPRVQVHDCRENVVRAFSEPDLFEAWLLAGGLKQTREGAGALREKSKKTNELGMEPPDKLLYTVGQRGFQKEQFQFPRSIVTAENGDIFITDSGNHRIQQYNQCGVYIGCFGEKGTGPGQFREPSGLALSPHGTVVIADRKNKRIQVLYATGESQYEFKTVHEPFYVCCDAFSNIIVSTITGFIEVYRRNGSLQKRFQIHGLTQSGQKSLLATCPIAVNNKDEVLVAHPISGRIQYYSYTGDILYQFKAESTSPGLACQPAGISITPAGQVVIADSLNHMILMYSERGSLLAVLAGPTDCAGAVQSVALGVEGHLVASEYSVNGPHCVKIFRYAECDCHRTRPGSAKKSNAKSSK